MGAERIPESGQRGLPQGSMVGRYRILQLLRIGGMAEVYLASADGPVGFKKHVVLKRILPELARDAQFVDMFADEARIAATLQHHNVAQVYDMGDEAGGYYYTMERVHGESVRDLLDACRRTRIPLELDAALAIAIGAATGLHYAHERRDEGGTSLGIVHRDVTPSNLMVSFDGVVKVLDFGIAKAVARRAVTLDGRVKGKPGYMAPEQIEGGGQDRRTDVYGLGALLYELTTGRPLISGTNQADLLSRVLLADYPKPSALRADYPRDLERVVLRALSTEPAGRQATAAELADELERIALERGLGATPAALARLMREVYGPAAAMAAPTPDWGLVRVPSETDALPADAAAGARVAADAMATLVTAPTIDLRKVTRRQTPPAPAPRAHGRTALAVVALLAIAGLGFVAGRQGIAALRRHLEPAASPAPAPAPTTPAKPQR